MKDLILYDIFSYSCMNCLRSAGYIKKIDSRYKTYGLQTIIIHPPEWDFEKKSENISAGLRLNSIKFPFIADKERKLIKEFGINFWPTQVLVSQDKVVYKHIGEGNYKELENQIIDILRIKDLNFKKLFKVEPKFSKYPTVYCGKKKRGKVILSKNIDEIVLSFGSIYIKDKWDQQQEYLRSTADNQSLTIDTKGKIINFVAESITKNPIKLALLLNNKFIKKLEINKPQLYNLLHLKTLKPQKLTLVTEKNLAVYSFSFQ